MSSLVHLHAHTEFSLLDGLAGVGEALRHAVDQGQPALAVTDHGSVAGIYSAWREAEKLSAEYGRPFRALGGVEFYWVPDRHHPPPPPPRKEEGGERVEGDQLWDRPPRRQHLTVLIQDARGYGNLMALVAQTNAASMRGGWGRSYPLLDWELLEAHHEGLLVLSGCGVGPLACAIRFGEEEGEAVALARRFRKLLGDRYYAEIMPTAFPPQREINRGVIAVAEEVGLRLVATNDNHWVRREDHETHKVLLAIQTKTTLDMPSQREGGRRMELSEGDYYLRSREEMETAFREQHPYLGARLVAETLDRSLEVAERVTYRHPWSSPRLPPFQIPQLHQCVFEEWRKEKGLAAVGGWQWTGFGSAEEFYEAGRQRERVEE